MAALDYLNQFGLTVELNGDKLRLRPTELITADIRLYVNDHRSEIMLELQAVNDPLPCWLHLLALDDGRVIQTCGVLDTATAKQRAHQQYGDAVLTVLAVPGFDRLLSDEQIVKALAGTLEPPPAPLGLSPLWLPRIARLLGVTPAYLLEGGYLDANDLVELADIDPQLVAEGIRGNPAWLARTAPHTKRTH